jgi:aminoglycoside/choline kinase family phosphotransferase
MAYLDKDALERATFPVAAELLGHDTPRLATLPGGASIRHYHRVSVGARSLLVMELGDDPLKSEEASKGAVRELPFLNVQRYLSRAGVAVPEVYRYDSKLGLVYLEDLGDVTFESQVADSGDDRRGEWYRLAIDELVKLQSFAAAHPDADCVAFSRGFDFELLKWELDHFREYGLEAQGHSLTPSEREEVERHFRNIAEQIASSPRIFVHRDYQSRNLMVQASDGKKRLRVIDFQDALLGSAAYDLVGLLRDSYVSLSTTLLDRLVDDHAAKAGHPGADFRALFDLQTVQRKLKDAGRFVFIDRVKKNPSFLVHIPNSLEYVRNAFSRLPELATLQEILGRYLASLK